jgi:LacI family transcriptional regulator
MLRGAGIPTAAPNDRQAGRLAAEHLLSLGHRRVAQLAGAPDISSFEGRANGFREAVVASGHELVETGDVAVEPSVPEGRRLAEYILKQSGLPTGVFAHNDLMALGLLTALRDHGLRCPDDLSVIGCDDLPFTAYTTPPLTTVNLPGYQLGRIAAEMLVTMAEDPTHKPSNLTVTPTVTVRSSTAEPRSART